MSGRILVLGAAGRLGFVAAGAFRDAGWTVTGLVRPRRADAAPQGIKVVEAMTREEAVEAARGCDVVLNAFNPALTEWQQHALPLTYSAIAVAEESGATLIFPGNLWNYGSDMPLVIDENTPMQPTIRKGRMRVEMEQRIREACERGMRAIVLRAGDFFGAGRGSWFDLLIAKDISQSRLIYPGPFTAIHAWAYLPDLAATLVGLAERRQSVAPFESFGFAGHTMTGNQLIATIEDITGAKFNASRLSWWMLKSIGRLSRMGRELAELEYLWRVPHRISGDKLQAAIGDVPHTPLPDAIRESLKALGYRFSDTSD